MIMLISVAISVVICFQTLLLLPLIYNSEIVNPSPFKVVICFQTLLLLPLIYNWLLLCLDGLKLWFAFKHCSYYLWYTTIGLIHSQDGVVVICFQTLLLLPLIYNPSLCPYIRCWVVICFQTLLLLPLIYNMSTEKYTADGLWFAFKHCSYYLWYTTKDSIWMLNLMLWFAFKHCSYYLWYTTRHNGRI